MGKLSGKPVTPIYLNRSMARLFVQYFAIEVQQWELGQKYEKMPNTE